MSEPLRPRLHSETHGIDSWTGIYHTSQDEVKVKVMFERILDGDNGAIWCEARAIIQIGESRNAVIPPSRTNLMNASRGGSGWKGLVATLSDMATEIRWDEAIAEGVTKAIEHYRNGERERQLETEGITPEHPFLLEPFIASTGTSVFYGEGGTGKSLIVLAMAVVVASGKPLFGYLPHLTGPVLYFDYEDDHQVHEERLAAILKGADIELVHPIFHRSLVAKVSQSQASMRRSVTDRKAVLAVLDSIGMGRGGSATGAEDTIRLFRALRSLQVPVLAVDHVTKDDKKESDISTPYGSIYTVNSARLLWGAVALTDEPLVKYLGLTNTKTNRTERYSRRRLRIEYRNKESSSTNTRHLDVVKFQMVDEFGMNDDADAWDLIHTYLQRSNEERRTLDQIIRATGVSEMSIIIEVTKHRDVVETERNPPKPNTFWLKTTHLEQIEMEEREETHEQTKT